MRLINTLKQPALALALCLCLAVATSPAARAQAEAPGQVVGAAADWLQQLAGQLPLPGNVGQALSAVLTALRNMGAKLDSLGDWSMDQLKEAQDQLRIAWTGLKDAIQASGLGVGGALSVVDASLQRLFSLIIVETSGQVTFADGSPAPNTLVVQFVAYEEGFLTGQPGVGTPIPTGFAVTDAGGNYTIQHWGGLTAAFRNATGQAQADGLLPTYAVWPVELLPADPPYRLITYSADGQPSTSAGQQPLAFWQILGL